METTVKPNLRQLCRIYQLNPLRLMQWCDPWLAWAMLLDFQVSSGDAYTALDVFNYLAKTQYTLDDIQWKEKQL